MRSFSFRRRTSTVLPAVGFVLGFVLVGGMAVYAASAQPVISPAPQTPPSESAESLDSVEGPTPATESNSGSDGPDGPAFVVAEDGSSYGRLDAPPKGGPAEELLAAAPDFVAVTSRDGELVVGYVLAKRLFGAEDWIYLDVVAPDLRTVVGRYYLNVGFVSPTESLEDLPKLGESTEYKDGPVGSP